MSGHCLNSRPIPFVSMIVFIIYWGFGFVYGQGSEREPSAEGARNKRFNLDLCPILFICVIDWSFGFVYGQGSYGTERNASWAPKVWETIQTSALVY